MGGRSHDSEQACRLWMYPTEYRIAHPFEATPGNLDIQSHAEHIHMQIDGNEVVALGLLAGMGLPDVYRHHEKYAKVGQWSL